MIFVLTDGATERSKECLDLAGSLKPEDNTLIHTFGIGNDCDKNFVQQLASYGGGVCVCLSTDEVSQLRSKVIKVLSMTLQPSLKQVRTAFHCKNAANKEIGNADGQMLKARTSIEKAEEIFRNQLYTEFFVIDSKAYQEA
jgi:hypothetical protein